MELTLNWSIRSPEITDPIIRKTDISRKKSSNPLKKTDMSCKITRNVQKKSEKTPKNTDTCFVFDDNSPAEPPANKNRQVFFDIPKGYTAD